MTVEERLRRLERENRILKLSAFGIILPILLVAGLAANSGNKDSDIQKVVKANRIELYRDTQLAGVIKVEQNDLASVEFYDRDGKQVLSRWSHPGANGTIELKGLNDKTKGGMRLSPTVLTYSNDKLFSLASFGIDNDKVPYSFLDLGSEAKDGFSNFPQMHLTAKDRSPSITLRSIVDFGGGAFHSADRAKLALLKDEALDLWRPSIIFYDDNGLPVFWQTSAPPVLEKGRVERIEKK